MVYATFWQRAGALIIDTIICYIADISIQKQAGVTDMLQYIVARQKVPASSILFFIVTTAISWLYYAIMESGARQATLGKMALDMNVTDTDGNRISFSRATARYFGQYVSAIILCIGYLMMFWDTRRQTLHDKIAGTLVIKRIVYAGDAV